MGLQELQGERERRAAKNQSLFRDVNERIEALGPTSSYVGFVCECANESCHAQAPMTVEEYEAVRRVPTRFAVSPRHDFPEVERVVERVEPRYWVVEKFGEGGRAAVRLDPRSRRRA